MCYYFCSTKLEPAYHTAKSLWPGFKKKYPKVWHGHKKVKAGSGFILNLALRSRIRGRSLIIWRGAWWRFLQNQFFLSANLRFQFFYRRASGFNFFFSECLRINFFFWWTSWLIFFYWGTFCFNFFFPGDLPNQFSFTIFTTPPPPRWLMVDPLGNIQEQSIFTEWLACLKKSHFLHSF